MSRYFILIFFFAISVSAYAQDKDQAKNLAKARKLYDKGKLADAVKLLDKCIEKDPDYAEYYYLRSACFFYGNNANPAMADITKAIQLHPDSFKYFEQRAAFYHKMLDFYKSNADYEKALALEKTSSDSASVLALMGMNFEALGDTLGALTNMEKALELDSNNAIALNSYGLLMTDLGEYDKAIACMKHMLRIDSTDLSAIHNLGYVYGVQGDYKNSIIYLDKTIEDKEDAFAYSNRGYAKMKLGDLTGASLDLDRSIELDPYNSYVYRNLGLLLLEQGEKDKACKAFETALFYHFSEKYGSEVNELRKKHCAN